MVQSNQIANSQFLQNCTGIVICLSPTARMRTVWEKRREGISARDLLHVWRVVVRGGKWKEEQVHPDTLIALLDRHHRKRVFLA